jgi:hypothetical protein
MVSLLAAAWLPADAKPPRPCWVPTRFSYSGRSNVVYTPPAEARLREAEQARLERREPRDVLAGWLALEIDRTTLAAADPAHQLVVVLRDGGEVARLEPASEIPEMNPEMLGFWFSYAVVQLPEGVAPPFDVEVTDRLLSVKCTWTVDAGGTAVLQDRREDASHPESGASAIAPVPASRRP